MLCRREKVKIAASTKNHKHPICNQTDYWAVGCRVTFLYALKFIFPNIITHFYCTAEM